jgi:hypothetical protein
MLRWQLDTTPESVADFELAGESRYWDGCQLITQGHDLGGIYLLGYVAEIILKHACFRADRGRPADPVGGFFGPIRSWMNVRYPSVDREAYHSLLFWTCYLRGKRREIGTPLSDSLDLGSHTPHAPLIFHMVRGPALPRLDSSSGGGPDGV